MQAIVMTSSLFSGINTLEDVFFAESLSFKMDVRLFILVLLCLALQGAASQARPAGKGELVQPVQVKSTCCM